MKLMKNAKIMAILLLVLSVVASIGFVAYKSFAVVVPGPGRPEACAEGVSCTTGDTCCWNTIRSSRQITCVNGRWPGEKAEAACPATQSCSKQGPGGKCVNQGAEPKSDA